MKDWNEEDFNDWKNMIEAKMLKRYGASLDNLPDQPFADMYQAGLMPSEAMKKICANLKKDGFPT